MLMIKILFIVVCVILIIGISLFFLPFILIFIGSLVTAKYEYIKVYHEDSNSWTIEPVMLPCGEPIDKEYIKEWEKAEKDYKEWRKRNK